MEGLRGFAVFLVFLVHYVTLIEPWLTGNPRLLLFVQGLRSVGNTGVDLFFVLSGYLIYGSLIARQQRFVTFMTRRIERIYPAFIAVFLAYVGLSFVFPSERKIPDNLLGGSLYLTQNFFLLPGLFPIEPMITVAWSLSYEMFYYLTIPLVIGIFRLRSWKPVSRISFFLLITTLVLTGSSYVGSHIRLLMFVSGMLLYEVLCNRLTPNPTGLVGLAALGLGLLSRLLPIEDASGHAIKFGILFISFFVVCLVCFRNPHNWFSRVFSWTPGRWLGNMSYSYYLLHGLALKAVFLVLPLVLPATSHYHHGLFWLLMPLMFGLTLIPTTALFLAVERPFSLSRYSQTSTRPSL